MTRLSTALLALTLTGCGEMSGAQQVGVLILAMLVAPLVVAMLGILIYKFFSRLGVGGVAWILGVAIGLALVLFGCATREAPSGATAPSGLAPGQPTVATCAGTPCWCAEPATAYERCGSGVSNFPTGYAGSGSRVVTVLTASPAAVHCWPATACGDLMAANDECPCTIGRYAETEILARELTAWPGECSKAGGDGSKPLRVGSIPTAGANCATFRLRPGLDYWLRQGAVTVYVSADAESVGVAP
jgi:hypothetical protein